jgi:DNA-binding response OmpR family regulator
LTKSYVLDVRVPGVSGLDLSAILGPAASKGTSILFTSAGSSNEDIANSLAAGAGDYLPKPLVGPKLQRADHYHSVTAGSGRYLPPQDRKTDPMDRHIEALRFEPHATSTVKTAGCDLPRI